MPADTKLCELAIIHNVNYSKLCVHIGLWVHVESVDGLLQTMLFSIPINGYPMLCSMTTAICCGISLLHTFHQHKCGKCCENVAISEYHTRRHVATVLAALSTTQGGM